MKKYTLLGLAAFLFLALLPANSKADDFPVYVNPRYDEYGPYYDRDEYWDHHHHHWNEEDWYRWRIGIITTTTTGITAIETSGTGRPFLK